MHASCIIFMHECCIFRCQSQVDHVFVVMSHLISNLWAWKENGILVGVFTFYPFFLCFSPVFVCLLVCVFLCCLEDKSMITIDTTIITCKILADARVQQPARSLNVRLRNFGL